MCIVSIYRKRSDTNLSWTHSTEGFFPIILTEYQKLLFEILLDNIDNNFQNILMVCNLISSK